MFSLNSLFGFPNHDSGESTIIGSYASRLFAYKPEIKTGHSVKAECGGCELPATKVIGLKDELHCVPC